MACVVWCVGTVWCGGVCYGMQCGMQEHPHPSLGMRDTEACVAEQASGWVVGATTVVSDVTSNGWQAISAVPINSRHRVIIIFTVF